MVVERLLFLLKQVSVSFEKEIKTNKINCMRKLINTFLFFSSSLVFIHCSGQTKTAMEAQKLANEIKEKTSVPGESPGANIYMKATIDGKPWTATQLIRDNSIG